MLWKENVQQSFVDTDYICEWLVFEWMIYDKAESKSYMK